MNGILLINKPIDYTSRDVVNKVSKILNTKKIGHTGTLDPIATGLLVLTIGNATKISELITGYNKEYIVTFKFGMETDTLDITGNKLFESNNQVNKEVLLEVLKKYKGKVIQEVPKYSAIKIDGKKLYEYARNNIDIELPKREINIYELELLEYSDEIKLRCKVSKGTYIRSLIRDIGRELNTYATMTSLIRTKQGDFNLKNSFTIQDIENNKYKIISLNDFFCNYDKIYVDDIEYRKVINGNKIKDIYEIKKFVAIYHDDLLLAIYEKEDDYLKPYKMLNNNKE
ncbi:MAG: tRNA pseudouridine(55) synthase TruB [Tenericutes bacterium]|nr:tRNA pseudouridine(55) synthase TruB [Bacilli bacterium]MDD3995920.1 tRNA pseudouridine(55) synthase TruB [Bacilli bacterium]MDD4623821.1 tRNA pseudouridine(55) synthase TruB [Bacilli bacterium]NLV90734.1 tRNA pseudouridine(55) synthase TruB [Mycoplasmatota bacterium]